MIPTNHLLALLVNLVVASALYFRDNCGVECEASVNAALASDTKDWVNVDVTFDPFYSNPTNISEYAVGDLVRWEDATAIQAAKLWNIPAGMSLSRFLYMSEDIDGKPIPATAFVLFPWSNPQGNAQPFRTVVWTHGTAGRSRQCAPSNNRVLYYDWEGPFALAQAGYVVIAPDYAGQGSDIPQGFMYESGVLHAGDVSYGLQAARAYLGDRLSREWIVIGHSEGGMSAWRTNEREARDGKSTGGFIGAVSAAPALRPLSLIPESFRRANGGPVGDVPSIYFLQSLSKLFESINFEDYVTDIVASRIAIADKGCLDTGMALFSNLTKDQLYKDTSWLAHPDVVDWQNRFNGVGPHALAAPMLIVQGVNDTVTYPEIMEEDLNATCETFPESNTELLLYPDLDHDPAFQAAQADYLTWIADRFDGVPMKPGCTRRTVSPARAKYSLIQQEWEARSGPA